MTAVQNLPLFHEITATQHPDPAGNQGIEELLVKLRAWLDDGRCVLIFTVDDVFHRELYPGEIACRFSLRGHDVLVMEAEEITVELLNAAFLSEPQYYLKTDVPAEAVHAMLRGCLKDADDAIGRNDDFDKRALHGLFGDFIMVSDWWQKHYILGEKEIIALDEDIRLQRAAEPEKSLWRRLSGKFRLAVFVLVCLIFIIPLFIVALWLSILFAALRWSLRRH